MADTLKVFGKTYTGVTGIIATDTSDTDKTYVRPQGTKSIIANGTNIDVASYATVDVNVQSGSTINNQDKTVSPTESQQSITADLGYTGLGTVTVSAISSTYVGSGVTRRSSSDINITKSTGMVNIPSGYYDTALGFGLTTQAGTTITPTETEQTAVAADRYTTGVVLVGAISSTYVGSGITQRDSNDLTTSGATVTVPAGYYSSSVSKSVATMTLPTSASSSATSGYTKKATISRSTSTQYINIAPGYNSAGGYYEISAVANGSATGPTSLSGSSATVTTGTNTITLTKTNVTTTPTVSAGYVSSATASTATVTLTASVTTKAAATITPGTTNQTIAAGTYITGTQTIAGDADLVGSNILSTANIFNVQGTVVVQNYYTGSSAPSSSLGQNGDIYIQQ